MAITDLTNTTWKLNSSLTSYAGGTSTLKSYQVNITTDKPLTTQVGNEYSAFNTIQIGYDSGPEENCVYIYPVDPELEIERTGIAYGHDTKILPDSWNEQEDVSFTITGGTDATNTVLIAWLEDNASIPFVPSPNFLDGTGLVTLLTKIKPKLQPATATVTLTTAGWSNNTQTVNVTGVTASNNVIVSAAPSSITAYSSAGVYCSAQGAGTLTFTCASTPTAALTVNVLIM